MEDKIEALRKVLGLAPDNHPLRLLLAEALEEGGRDAEALEEYRLLAAEGALGAAALLRAGETAADQGDLAFARQCLAEAEARGAVQGLSSLRSRIDRALEERGVVRLVRHDGPAEAAPSRAQPDEPAVTFDGVGGMEELKKVVHRLIVLPYRRPELYKKYGRSAGGGVMLYGPPGCGKTLVARATAGECGLPFFNVRIEDILDPYIGVSERNLHEAFESARQAAPCVLFLDELDAIAFARRKSAGGAHRPLVDQLLQEMDAMGADNRDVLILGATNAPWDVDDALKRPGRFDRLLFVPPPDEAAREQILGLVLRDRPAEGVQLQRLARETPLFSGADLRALVEQATDLVIEEALETGDEPPLTQRHLEAARAALKPTTVDWLGRARNYVEFSNQNDQYKDVAAFLRSRETARWLR